MPRKSNISDEKAIAILLHPYYSNHVVSIHSGLSISAIETMVSRFRLKKIFHRWKKKDDEYILKHYNKIETASEIAEHLNRSRWAIINRYRFLIGKRKK